MTAGFSPPAEEGLSLEWPRYIYETRNPFSEKNHVILSYFCTFAVLFGGKNSLHIGDTLYCSIRIEKYIPWLMSSKVVISAGSLSALYLASPKIPHRA